MMKIFLFVIIFVLAIVSSANSNCSYYFSRFGAIPYSSYKDHRTLGVKVKVEDFKQNSWIFDIGNSAYQYIKPSQRGRSVILMDIFQSGRSNKVYLLVAEKDVVSKKTILLEFDLMKVRNGAKSIFNSNEEIYNVDVSIPWKKPYLILTGRSLSTGIRDDVRISQNNSYIILFDGSWPIRISHSSTYYGMNRWARQAITGYARPITEITSMELKSKVLNDGDVVWDKDGQYVLKKEGTRIEVSELDLANKKLNVIQIIDLIDSKVPPEIERIFGKISVTRR